MAGTTASGFICPQLQSWPWSSDEPQLWGLDHSKTVGSVHVQGTGLGFSPGDNWEEEISYSPWESYIKGETSFETG